MPSATFFNLPAEKRQRLLDAAWEELTTVSFEKASINHIIRNANISRGSFYQYFADKNDLLHFLLEQACCCMEQALRQHEDEHKTDAREDDLFAAALKGFDWVMARRDDKTLHLPQMIRLVQLNPEMDLSSDMALAQRNGGVLDDSAKTARFWQTDQIKTEDHLELLCNVVGGAMLQSFRCPENAEGIREKLKKQLVILKRGMLAEPAKGATE